MLTIRFRETRLDDFMKKYGRIRSTFVLRLAALVPVMSGILLIDRDRRQTKLTMLFKTLTLAVCGFVLVLGLNNCVFAQTVAVSNTDADLAAMQLENVQIEAQSVGSLFSDLALSYDIPLGLEIALNDNELAEYRIEFKKGSLAELLTQFVTEHKQYAWEVRDGVVNVFPNENYRDAIVAKLLAAQIGRFSVKENTSSWDLQQSLVSTPEIRTIREANGITAGGLNFTGFYFPQLGRHFTFDVSNMTLKSILNKVVKESPTARCWLMKRYRSGQTFYIRLGARHEDSPVSKGGVQIPR